MADVDTALPCLKCGRELRQIGGFTWVPEDNQPDDGVEFFTHGHYGSTVFDPCDGSKVIINVCDPCVSDALKSGLAVEISHA